VGGLRIAAIALLALLAGAAPAAAATPRFLGTGHDPGVAVDRAGTAHVGWFTGGVGGGGTLEYCQVPRRGRGCTLRHTFQMAEAGSAKVQVLAPRPGAVHIVAPVLSGDTLLFNSADGGATFAPPVSLRSTGTVENAVFGPGETLSLMSQVGPPAFGRYGLDGSGPDEMPVEFGSATEALETRLVPLGSGLAAVFSGLATRSVIWNGLGDPNLQQSWVEGPRLGDERVAVTAAGGRSGAWVAYVDHRGSRNDTRVRRLRNSGRFGKAKRITRDSPASLEMAQGPRGDMAVLWSDSDDAYMVRSRKGRRWTRPRRLVRGNDPSDLVAALGRRGGWLVWDASAGNFGSNPIRIAAIPRAPKR
jgi:hypothetical protein